MYEVIDLETGDSHGLYDCLGEARGCVRYDRLTAYQIWRGNVRVEECDPYLGDDDWVREALGEANPEDTPALGDPWWSAP